MADVNDDVQTRTAVSGYRLVHRAVERRDERLERVALFARPEAHSRPVALRRDVLTNTSTPRFIHGPGKVSWITVTMLDLPDRGAPFRMTIWPGFEATVVSGRSPPAEGCRRGW